MSADGIDTILLNGAFRGDNEVGGLALETLRKVAIAFGMGLEPL